MNQEKPRVLVVEDHDVLRVMMFTILRHQPLGVDTAGTADEAIERIMTCDYALILIDLDLEDGDAERFLREFRERRPEATSFIIGVRDPANETAVQAEGVLAIVNKPVAIDTLAEVVRECAIVVPPPDDPLPCPPAESDTREIAKGPEYLSN